MIYMLLCNNDLQNIAQQFFCDSSSLKLNDLYVIRSIIDQLPNTVFNLLLFRVTCSLTQPCMTGQAYNQVV